MISNKHTMCRCFVWLLNRASVAFLFLILGMIPATATGFDMLLGTGDTGTFSHFTGKTISRILNRYVDDISCQPVPAPDAVDNLTNVQGGSLDIALVDSRIFHDALNKTGPFEFLDIRYDDLRVLLPLYDIPITIVARKDVGIPTLNDLKGKRLNAGAPGSPQHLAADMIMKAKQWSRRDFSLVGELPASQSQDSMAFCHGTMQAMVHVGVHPDSALAQLFRLCKARLVNMDDSDIEKLIREHPAFFNMTIAADTYRPQPGIIKTFGTRAMLVVSKDLDAQTAYTIIEAILGHGKRLASSHPALSSMAVKAKTLTEGGVPLHPGAVRYFSEHGW